ncbi:MAG: ABC-F family ATP-binding cassette domain-containing protein [Gammaproteobacteria bacterium]|nr:ABC-F family ATP-binding cassette domain-containing protein [Gammaproteobacteria bacterium]MCW5584153.1 ABC-F family ATP-binding cassette domain-containing protein [Gammaproteobacteria bacterium]
MKREKFKRDDNGKVILEIEHLIFSYPESNDLFIKNFSLTIKEPERIALCGTNGSGKTTLIKLILNELQPSYGEIFLGTERISYLDQNTMQLNPEVSILDNFLRLNSDTKENEAYQALAQFLFKNTSALKLVKHLSGGEKLRALLACTLKSSNPPQLLILDEPTNHLDLNSMKSIESALKNYQGAMIVISHDQSFLESIGIERIIYAPFKSAD